MKVEVAVLRAPVPNSPYGFCLPLGQMDEVLVVTNAEARFNNSLRPRKPEGSLGRTAQDGHLDSHTAPEL